MSLFSRKPKKVVLVLSPNERKLAVMALTEWRNKLLRQRESTEDVNELIRKVMK